MFIAGGGDTAMSIWSVESQRREADKGIRLNACWMRCAMSELTIATSDQLEQSFPLMYQDVLPVALERLPQGEPLPRAEIESTPATEPDAFRPDELAEDGVSELVWRKLVSIERKLDFLMEMITMEQRTTTGFSYLPVVLNEYGLRVKTGMAVSEKDRMRIRVRIPVIPPTYLMAAGIVTRIREERDGQRDVVIGWVDLDDAALRLIRFYAMNRQREVIRKQRQERV